MDLYGRGTRKQDAEWREDLDRTHASGAKLYPGRDMFDRSWTGNIPIPEVLSFASECWQLYRTTPVSLLFITNFKKHYVRKQFKTLGTRIGIRGQGELVRLRK